MTNPLTRKAWSPYAVGAAIGVLSWFAFATADRPIGITTAFEHTAALAGKASSPSLEETHPYYREKAAKGESPKIGWEWMLVVGVFVGALLSSFLSGDRTSMKVPPLWKARFGDGTAKRFAAAFLGGAVMMFGARLAQGCTSGHGISGALQLAASSWLFVAVMFPAAVAAAYLLYGKEGARHV
ncbi:MAG TPA: YeeE/YedE thiosulfate transporter family protein [Planctomycetaceae bacterium]